jgi:hypothetical protein
MRILFASPHYYEPRTGTDYGSLRSAPAARAQVTRQCLASLRQNFAQAQSLLNGAYRCLHPANERLSATIAVALCTTGDSHLVPELTGCGFDHIRTEAHPTLLGFECHKVLRGGLGQYDYFAYLEDDLRVSDALLFAKLAWFTAKFGTDAVLQPNRFEISADPAPYKLYIDGNLDNAETSRELQRIEDRRYLEASLFGPPIVFQRVDNPHSGCFFLNAEQFEYWAGQPDFAEPSARFGGPLESAATLGLMRHFRVYKPSREDAGFLEIEHLDPRYLGRVFRPVAGDPAGLRYEGGSGG